MTASIPWDRPKGKGFGGGTKRLQKVGRVGMGFGVQGLGFRVGMGFGVQGLGFIWGLGFRVCMGFRV